MSKGDVMKRILIILIVIVLMIPLCAGAKKPKGDARPVWVDNPKTEYPDAMFLSAVGSGGSRAEAENNAAGNLAKIFRSDITAQTTFSERYHELMSATSAKAETETKMQKDIKVTASQNLFNIEIGKTWTDNLGQVYAVAYLHRLKTADIYEQRIVENNRQIMNYLNQSKTSDNPWQVYALLNAATVINQNNEELLSQLEIISLDTRRSISTGYSPDALKLNLAQAARAISFNLEVKGDVEGKISAVISETLTTNGFELSPLSSATLKAEITFEDVQLNQPQKFVRYTLALSVYDDKGNVLISLSDNNREGHLNKDEAKARAIRTLSAKIKTELPKRLFGYFDGLVKSKK